MSRHIINYTCVRKLNTKIIPKQPNCDHVPKKYKGPDYEKLQNLRKKYVSPSMKMNYSTPLAIHQGYMQWLYDIQGRRYLDMFGGIATVSVGHCHPKITEAVINQMTTLSHCSNLYMHPTIQEYAEKLAEKMPGDLKVVYFVNSGSEANDLATLIARLYTENFDIISLRNGYHGLTCQVMGMSNLRQFKFPVPVVSGTHQAMNPDVFRGPWGGSHCRDSPVQTTRICSCEHDCCEAKDRYVEQLDDLYKHCLVKGKVAAFFAESIQGVGGTVQFPKGYLKEAYKMIKENGGLYIADEVQTGFGRTGDHFWGFQGHGIQPDIVTMAKGIGNGFPLAAVVTTPEISNALLKGGYFNTFGGNPVACAVGKAVLEVIETDKCQEISKEVGTYLLKRLEDLRDRYNIVGDVRGKGLMIGIELVNENGTKNPLPKKEFLKILDNCKEMGLIIGNGGLHTNVLRLKPPMCITKEDADFTVDVLDRAFDLNLNNRLLEEQLKNPIIIP